MPKFASIWLRFSAALISSNLTFAPFLAIAATSALTRLDVQADLGGWALGALTFFVFCEAIIIVAIFTIAYPIERWLVKPSESTAKSASRYMLLGVGSMAINFLLVFSSIAQITNLGWLPVYLFFGSAIGTFTAYLGRMIYPRILKILSNQKNQKIKVT